MTDGDAIALDDAARARPRRATPPSWTSAPRAVTREQPYTIIYTSGTTGPPKGCVLTPRQLPRRRLDVRARRGRAGGRRRLPVPPARALLRAADPARGARPRRDARLLRRRPEADRRRALRGQADLPAVGPAHLREALHAGHRPRRRRADPAPRRRSGSRSARCRPPARRSRPSCRRTSTRPRRQLFKNVRAAFGGRLRQATSGAAPIAKEILEFFFACGVPVLEGYGMTETATAATASTVDNYRFGSVGRALPGHGDPDRRRRRGAAQGPEHLPGLLQATTTPRSARSSTAGCTRATSARVDEDGFLFITGRKKDIIITAGGKNLTPANLENDLKQSRWISQAVMHGDRRPYPVALITLDPEEIVHFAREHGLPEDIGGAVARAGGDRADPGRARPRQRALRAGGEDQAVRASSTTTCRRRRAS